MPKSKRTNKKLYLPMLGAAFLLGAGPAAMTLTVDPYQMFLSKQRPTAINDIAEKAHYPLWKLAKFQRGQHDTVILGDSRARSLRDKYWHELKMPQALNLAYGGGTIPEVYSTFKLIKSDPAIQNLIVGVQLRSFDERHKGGMNRVPEAVELVRHKLEYLKNWNVFQTTIKMFEKENEETITRYSTLITKANAASLGTKGKTSLSTLLQPEVCYGCDLPTDLPAIAVPSSQHQTDHNGKYHHTPTGWGRGSARFEWRKSSSLYQYNTHYQLPELTGKFERQVRKNGKSDWHDFQFSDNYWKHFEEIGAWAKAENKNLIFVIPPTITQMQNTIQKNGLGELNHQMRLKLAEMGTVVDLDFPNSITNDTKRFSDAYHFDSKVARQIVGQVIPLITKNKDALKKTIKRERDMKCHLNSNNNSVLESGNIRLTKGENCRVWRTQR